MPILARSLSFSVLSGAAIAQIAVGPSVLDLQRAYHVGTYGAAVDAPSGAVQLVAQQGTIAFALGGGLTGALDTWEWDSAGGTFTPNDPLAGTYHVLPRGIVVLDLDPSNPGTDVVAPYIDPAGEVVHIARYDASPEGLSVLALAKSTGQSNASLNGTYRFYGQRMELNGASYQTTSERGTATFDGLGGVTFAGTELFVASSGAATTSSIGGSGPYSVAADGALLLAGEPGGISSNGELLLKVTGSLTSSEVGLTIAVRTGSSYDLRNLAGRYHLHGQSHELGTALGRPNSVTDIGVVTIAAASANTGTWSIAGQTAESNPLGQTLNPFVASGAAVLVSNGVVTLTSATGSFELAFAASGRFAAGRAVLANETSLFFLSRACDENFDYGSATAGSGGIEPELGMRTFPTLGNAGWRFAIVDGRGAAPAILSIGFGRAPAGIPFAGGLLWLDPARIVASPFVVLGGSAGTAGAGGVDVGLPIPSAVSYDGVKLFSQAFVLDPLAPAGVAMSRGFEVTFCR
ncbi:MAG: hypothetical protein KDE27_33135 [Planctomycetes bacterium]|nr:hypothetical protein [Planctomycetota bacterium]